MKNLDGVVSPGADHGELSHPQFAEHVIEFLRRHPLKSTGTRADAVGYRLPTNSIVISGSRFTFSPGMSFVAALTSSTLRAPCSRENTASLAISWSKLTSTSVTFWPS